MIKTYGYKRYECGCVCSLSANGTRQGYAEECPEARKIFSAMMADLYGPTRRPQTKEVSAEWKARFNSHHPDGS